MKFKDNIIPDLRRYLDEGQVVAIATLINVDGSSPRPLGSQIGVAADGRSVGMITGGCAERAIVAEALNCIEKHENKIVRYGEGSPYLDVVLPCGSGIDLYIETQSSAEIVHAIHEKLSARQKAFVEIDAESLTCRAIEDAHNTKSAFLKSYTPDYRLCVFGEGTNLVAFCTLADAAGYGVEAYSPDTEALAFLEGFDIEGRQIHQGAALGAERFDAYCAVITLFHEHEWESNILHAALNSNADYIGALGSRRTHDQRLEYLATLPPTQRSPDIISGPVGLDIGAQNPNEIAISILAEITSHRRRQ